MVGNRVPRKTGRTEGNESSQWSVVETKTAVFFFFLFRGKCSCDGWELAKRVYRTGCVGGHRAREPIALGLAEEVVDGGAQKRTALLLLTHQLWRQIDQTV